MSDVSQVLQSMSFLSQRERFCIACTKHHNLSSMELHILTLRWTLYDHALNLKTHTHVSSLENRLIVRDFLTVHYR